MIIHKDFESSLLKIDKKHYKGIIFVILDMDTFQLKKLMIMKVFKI